MRTSRLASLRRRFAALARAGAMARLLPDSLGARLSLLMLAGLALTQALAVAFVLQERGAAMQGTMSRYIQSDLASSLALLEQLPRGQREAWARRLGRDHYGLLLDEPAATATATATATAPAPAPAPAGHPRGSEGIGGGGGGASEEASGSSAGGQEAAAGPLVAAVAAALDAAGYRDARLLQGQAGAARFQLALADGQPLAVEVRPPPGPWTPRLVALLAVQAAVVALLAWACVRLALRPLRLLAEAAARLEPGKAAAGFQLQSPREVAQAASALQAMQARIEQHHAERLTILASLSHDLQTPLTRMQLRADVLDDGILRDKLLADLAEMQSLVADGLAYARTAQAVNEPERPVDLVALAQSVAADCADAGGEVEVHAVALAVCLSRPQALRRVLSNLVDNALKFAGRAEIHVLREAGRVAIEVRDEGPGIPAAEMQSVLLPYYRVEGSRNRKTGGSGLGLAIASRLSEAAHARLRLSSEPGHGVVARLEWDLQGSSAEPANGPSPPQA